MDVEGVGVPIPTVATVPERWGTMGAMGGDSTGQTSVQKCTRMLLT